MSERRGLRIIGVGLALGLGVAACASTPETTEPKPTEPIKEQSGSNESFTITQQYTPDGHRISYIGGINQQVDAFCDSRDLVEITTDFYGRSPSEVRSVGHVACVDGRLTPEDFPDLSQVTTTSLPR